ncbi:MAG: hypothetical protein ACYDCS_12730 [Candidatus Dormibacteria bacterium]
MLWPSRLSLQVAAALLAAATWAGFAAAQVEADTAPSAGPTEGSLFGAHPVQQGHTTLPGGHFNYALIAGGHISDGVVVENFTDHSIDFSIYGADLRSASGGGLAPAQPNDIMHEAGAWIVISKPRVTIPAHGQLTDNFTLTVPTTASPGEHLGAVVTSANVGTTPQGSVIEARTALIVVVTVPGSDHPSATLSPLRGSTAVPGQFSFAITLSNTGNLLLTYTGSVAVYDGHGRRVARLPLAPADAYVVPTGHVPLAAIWADTIAQSGTYRAQAVLTILANGKPVGTLTSQSLALSLASGIPILSVSAIALGCGLILLLLTWFIDRRMRTRRSLVAVRRTAESSSGRCATVATRGLLGIRHLPWLSSHG